MQERKRQKRDMITKIGIQATPDDVVNVLSPSFPSFSFSPVTGLKGSIGDFRKVLADSDDFSAALSLQKGTPNQSKSAPDQHFDFRDEKGDKSMAETPGASNAMPTTQETVLVTSGIPDLSEHISSQLSAGVSDSEKKGGELPRSSLDLSEKENDKSTRNLEAPNELPRAPGLPKKRRPSPAKLETEFDNVANESQILNTNKARTPERRRLTPDMEAARSPTRHGKEAATRSWPRLRGDLFGKEETIEVCRLPRILRVKMGSGRLLRKFEM